jgi:uncharacterized membrane protein
MKYCWLTLSFLPTAPAFNHIISPNCHRRANRPRSRQQTKTSLNAQQIGTSDQILALWVLSFASSHIGMSAIRTQLISSIGDAADSLNLVGNEEWRLPSWWPGDNTGGNRIFADSLTAGRQIYRVLYTAISFITLGSAFGAYLVSSGVHTDASLELSTPMYNSYLFAASLSFGAAIASLFNASPLGLMPSFEESEQKDSDATIAGIRRDDTLKFSTRGLTRITRHPLILPVVPWGIATAHLAGGRLCDYILFGGLSLYAVAGCYAQDLRVIREEGSVGTVFQTESREESEEKVRLGDFFAETSFIPFKAVLEGRQSIDDVCREAPWLQFISGTAAGVLIEKQILELLQSWSV